MSTLRRPLFAALVALFCLPALAQADRGFTPRYSTNDTGNIVMAGNTLMTCPASAAGCSAARNADSTNTTANPALNNNAYDMQYVDQDGSASTTFNSSRATLTIPTGATVLFAGLYYGGDFSTGSAAPPNKNKRDEVKFRAPGDADYTLLTNSVVDDSVLNVGRYQGYQDVTARVKAAGSGSYAIGDVQSGKGSDHYAGWSIIVVYRDTTEPARNLTVFDGLVTIRSNDAPTNIPVSGFRTPPAGPVRTALGFVTYEGDLGLVGDGAALNGTDLGDANSPKTNFFNSTIANLGGRFSAKDPDYTNQLGYDADIFNADGILGNNATSATIRVKTAGDQYLPGAITFATELFAPRIEQTKTATDVNGGALEQGDIVEYTIAGKNTGQDSAVNFALTDAIPANTTYVPGSLQVGAGARTDATDTDTAEYDAPGNQVRFRLGTGANATQGGKIAPAGTYSATFRVRVARSIPAGTKIPNTARATFNSDSLGTPLSAESSADVTVRSPDLAITKSRVGDLVPGALATYKLAVKNVGDARVQAGQLVTVIDTLPAGLTYVSAAGSGWSCTDAGQTITCTRSDELAANASYGDITIKADVDEEVTGTVENTATVAGGGDANPANNTSTDPSPANPSADLSIVKSADSASVPVGGTIVYTLKVKNNGVSKATNVSVTDTLPAGLTFVSATTTQGTCTSAISCAIGALSKNAEATVTVTAKATSAAAGTTTANTATVKGAELDPTPGNNTSTAKVDVTSADLAIEKTASVGPFTAGGPISYTLKVTNKGPSPATNVELRDALPAELATTPAPTVQAPAGVSCSLTSAVVLCLRPTLASGASFTVTIDARVGSDAGDGRITNTATVMAAENDPDSSNNSSTVKVDVASTADLALVKTAPNVAQAGSQFSYTLKVSNAGPSAATGVRISDELPAGVDFVSAATGCDYVAATRKVTCTIASVANGASASRTITVKVADATVGTVKNVATVKGDQKDPNPDDNTDDASTTVPDRAALSVKKTVSPGNVKSGDTATYTLVVSNDGPAQAKDVVLSDPLPAGVTFAAVRPGAPICKETAGTVSCAFGTLASGASRTVEIDVTTDVQTLPAEHDHQLPIDKAEVDIPLEAGQTRTVEVACGPGALMTDASVRTDAVDQGTGTLGSVQVLRTESIARNRYAVTVRNTAAGRAQTKAFGVCIPVTTTENQGHTHELLLSDPVTQTVSLLPGRSNVEVQCGPGSEPVAPGFLAAGGLTRLVASEPTAQGWRFGLEVSDDPSEVTVSVRCLNRRTSTTNGHAHDLQLDHIVRQVTVPAGATVSESVVCGDQAKGIVGTMDLAPGLISLGNDPQPKTRVFKLQNPTGGALQATIDLTCLGDRVGGPVLPEKTVVNTATVSSSTPDDDPSDNASSATLGVDAPVAPTPTPAPAPDPSPAAPVASAPVAPAPDAMGPAPLPSAPDAVKAPVVLSTSAIRVAGKRKPIIKVRLACRSGKKACRGVLVLRATKSVRVGSKRVKRGQRLASVRYAVKAGSRGTITVRLSRSTARVLRSKRVGTVSLDVRTTKNERITRKTVKLRR